MGNRLSKIYTRTGDDGTTGLGNGSRVLSSDTVPFAVWCAATYVTDYGAACWACASVGGDIDTTCAMVGGIVVGATGAAGIPVEWRACREPLPPI